MLDSDVPNPDSRLHVTLFSKPVKNDFRTQVEGRPIFEDKDFIKICVPGDQTTVIEREVIDSDKARFPLHWQHYQNMHGGDAKAVGTPLKQWSLLTPAQVEELAALKFYTVESVAMASDQQISRIGMAAGMGPYAFRERAQRYLKAAEDESYLTQQTEALKKAEAEREAMLDEMRAMREQMQELMANQKGKPGRKPKEQEGQAETAEASAA